MEFKQTNAALLASYKLIRNVCIYDYNQRFYKYLKKNATTIQYLYIFTQCDGEDFMESDLAEALKLLADSLTTLYFKVYRADEMNPRSFQAIEMPKLKSLETWSPVFLQLFMNSRITHLWIEVDEEMDVIEYARSDIKYFVDFLSVQVDLKVNCYIIE